MMTLELESLRKAIAALERSIRATHAAEQTEGLSEDLIETARAGVIQNFEVAYEQCWKFIQRWIRENRSREDADFPRTRKELFRLGARYGLISDPLPWFAYGEARNLAAHTYDPRQALSVYETATQFAADARDLLTQLEARND